ncbi:MATE family efflux transporter [Cardiobacteriaceae bacterium TAE3-ERU3]|nr:MATE family efflux transporter [Cardiobacteriaceae bacterium TAE3-ERU3]
MPSILSNIRPMLTLALPLIATNIAYVALTTIDLVVLGALGAMELAAGGLAIALFNQFRTAGAGVVTGLSNLTAEESLSQGGPKRIYALLGAGIFWAIVCSLLFIVLLYNISILLRWAGQSPEVIVQCSAFLAIIAPAMLPALLVQALRHFSTGLKRPGPLFWMMASSIVLSILSNYVLVFGHFGFPALGFRGAAISTLFTLSASLLIMYVMLQQDKKLKPWLHLSQITFERWAIGAVFRLGLPVALTNVAEASFFTVLALMIGTLGVDALAAQTIVNQVIFMVFMISAGFSHAASIHISEAFAHKAWQQAHIEARTAITLALLPCILIAALYLWIPEHIIRALMSGEAQSATAFQLAVHGLWFAALLQIFDAGQIIGSGILRGLNDTVTPLKWSLIGYWLIGIPTAWLLGLVLDFGIYGVWTGLGIGLAATATALLYLFHHHTNFHSIDNQASSTLP